MPPPLVGELLDINRNRTVVGNAVGEWCLRQIQLGVEVVRQASENLPLVFLLDLSSQFFECSIHQRGIVRSGNARPRSRKQVTVNCGGDPHTTHATEHSMMGDIWTY